MLIGGVYARSGPPASQPLELKPEWTVELKRAGSRPSRDGYLGVPYDPGSISFVACNQSVVSVTIDKNVVFFDIESGKVIGTKNLSSFPVTTPYVAGFARIFSVGDEHFLVDLNESALFGKEDRQRIVLLDSKGAVIHYLDFSTSTGFSPVFGVAVSTTGKSFLLSRFDSDEWQFQLRDSATFEPSQSWRAEKGTPYWQSLSSDLLLSIQTQPLGPGNRAGKQVPILVASPGTGPHQLGDVLAGGAAVLADDRILAIHVNELTAELVDDSGHVLRTYKVPFSAPHLYFQLASIASDGRYFATHFLGQKNFFLPGREYLYLWSVEDSEPIALLQFKWDKYFESETAFCSGDRKFAAVNNQRLELFDLPPGDHSMRSRK